MSRKKTEWISNEKLTQHDRCFLNPFNIWLNKCLALYIQSIHTLFKVLMVTVFKIYMKK